MKHSDSYGGVLSSMIKTTWGLIRGMLALQRIPRPRITIFGGSYGEKDSAYQQNASQLAALLARHGVSILTGGGPGIMQAANCGFASVPEVERKHAQTLGIGVTGIDETFHSPCASVIFMPNFFSRKLLMMHYSDAFAIFPGGIGTADELFDLLNLRKHDVVKQAPIFLVGSDYWKLITTWYMEVALPHEFIKPEYAGLFRVEDDLNRLCEVLCQQVAHIHETQ